MGVIEPVVAGGAARRFVRPHRALNAMHWRGIPPEVQAARKRPGWAPFHRERARHGLFCDDIDRAPGGGFRATTFRVEPDHRFYAFFRVSEAHAPTPEEACAEAVRAAAAAGFPIPADVTALLQSTPDLEALIG